MHIVDTETEPSERVPTYTQCLNCEKGAGVGSWNFKTKVSVNWDGIIHTSNTWS